MNYEPNNITLNYGISYLSSPPNIMGTNFTINIINPNINIDQNGIIYISEKLYVGIYNLIINCNYNKKKFKTTYIITVKPIIHYNLININYNSIITPILNPPLDNNDIFSFDYMHNDIFLDISSGNIKCNNLIVNNYSFHVTRTLNSVKSIYFLNFIIYPKIQYLPNEKYIYFNDIDYSSLPIIYPKSDSFIITSNYKINLSGILDFSFYDIGYYNIIVTLIMNNISATTNYNLYVLPHISYSNCIGYSFTSFQSLEPNVSQKGGIFTISGPFNIIHYFNINSTLGIININAPSGIYNLPIFYTKNNVFNNCLINITVNPTISYNNMILKSGDISYNYPICNENIYGYFSLNEKYDNIYIDSSYGIIELNNLNPNIYNLQINYVKNYCQTITNFKLIVNPVLTIITNNQTIDYGKTFNNIYFNIYPIENFIITCSNSSAIIYNDYIDINNIKDIGDYSISITATVNNMTDTKFYNFTILPKIEYPNEYNFGIYSVPYISDKPIIYGSNIYKFNINNLNISGNILIDPDTGIININNLNIGNYILTINYGSVFTIFNLSIIPYLIYPNQAFYYNNYNFSEIIALPINGYFSINRGIINEKTGIIDLSGLNIGNYIYNVTYNIDNIHNSAKVIIDISKNLINLKFNNIEKEYDGTTNVDIKCINYNDITISGNFINPYCGYRKKIIISSIILPSYLDINYYTNNNQYIGNIIKKTIYPNFISYNKIFDNTLDARVDISNEFIISYNSQYLSKNIGNQSINVSNILLNDNNNYILSSDIYTISSYIFPRIVNVNFNGVDKEYDGTTDASVILQSIDGAYEYLNIQINKAEFISSEIGNNIINITDYLIFNKNSNNYLLEFNTISANILPKKITLNIIANDKIYDGTTKANIYFNSNQKVLSYNAHYLDKNVNIRKIIYVSDIILEDKKYFVDNCTIFGNIQPKLINFNFIGNDKIYDGDPKCIGNYNIDYLAGDDIDTTFISEFKDINSRDNIEIKINNLTLIGKDAINYKIGSINTNTPTIFKKEELVIFYSIDKMYDNTSQAFVKILSLSNDIPLEIISLDANYESINVQNNILINIKNVVLAPHLFNYYISDTTCIGNIMKRELKLITNKPEKEYDGNYDIDIQIINILNIIINDNVYIESFTSKFVDYNANNEIIINISDIILTGLNSSQYICHDFQITGTIVPKYITINFIALDQEYNINMIPILQYTLDDNNLLIESYEASYYNIEIGIQKILIKNIILGGLHKDNYIVNEQIIYGNIITKNVDLIFISNDKVYDGNIIANVNCYNYFIENIKFDSYYTDPNVGINKEIIISNINYNNQNYSTLVRYSISGNIIPKEIFIYPVFEKYYDETINFNLNYSLDLSLCIVSYQCQTDTPDVGIKNIFVNNIILNNTNYIINNFTSSGIIYPKILYPEFLINNKIYDLSNNIIINTPINIVSYDAYYDNMNTGNSNIIIKNIKFENSNYMAYDITISSFINPKLLHINFNVAPKIYDKNYTAIIESYNILNTNEKINIISYEAKYENINIGLQNIIIDNIIVDNNNYYVETSRTQGIINPRPLNISFINLDKYYDQNTNTNISINSIDKLENDDINIISYNSYYEYPNVSNQIKIFISNIKFEGNDSNNYILNNYLLLGRILPRPIDCVFKNINNNIIGSLVGTLNNDEVYISNFISFNNNKNNNNQFNAVQNIILGGKDNYKYFIKNKIYNII